MTMLFCTLCHAVSRSYDQIKIRVFHWSPTSCNSARECDRDFKIEWGYVANVLLPKKHNCRVWNCCCSGWRFIKKTILSILQKTRKIARNFYFANCAYCSHCALMDDIHHLTARHFRYELCSNLASRCQAIRARFLEVGAGWLGLCGV